MFSLLLKSLWGLSLNFNIKYKSLKNLRIKSLLNLFALDIVLISTLQKVINQRTFQLVIKKTDYEIAVILHI